MPEYLSAYEVARSAKIGNHIARQLIANKPIRANAALRHSIATQSIQNATSLACELLGLSHREALALVHTLANTKPDDIVSPYFG